MTQETSEIKNSDENTGFELIHVSDFLNNHTATPYLIEGICNKEDLIALFGQSAHGKSFIALDMSLSIATGTEYHGRKIREGLVIYIAGEGQTGLKKRIKAWQLYHDIDIQKDALPFYISRTAADFYNIGSASDVAEAVYEVADEHIGNPVLVVIDTLARNFGAGNENSTEDMTQFLRHIDYAIKDRYGCAVMLIHHTGHTNKDRARGSYALKAALDCEYLVSKDGSDIIQVKNTKMKDDEPPTPIIFTTKKIELPWTKGNGDFETSLILEASDKPLQSSPGRLGKAQKEALKILDSLYKIHRENLESSGHDPSQAKVDISEWKEKLSNAGLLGKFERQRFLEISNSLIEKQLIEQEDPFVYLIKCSET